jgi:hypothetical protein
VFGGTERLGAVPLRSVCGIWGELELDEGTSQSYEENTFS